MKKIKILICDSHPLFREGIILALKCNPNYNIIGEAENGNDLIAKCELLNPDLILTDNDLPGLIGFEAIKRLKQKYPGLKTIFISMLRGDFYIYYTLKVGGFGLLNKNVNPDELLYAINEVLDGRYYFGGQYDDKKLKNIMTKYNNDPLRLIVDSIKNPTEIEYKILMYIGEGLSINEMTEKLSLGKRIIYYHRASLMRKYKLTNYPALMRFAVLYSGSAFNDY